MLAGPAPFAAKNSQTSMKSSGVFALVLDREAALREVGLEERDEHLAGQHERPPAG